MVTSEPVDKADQLHVVLDDAGSLAGIHEVGSHAGAGGDFQAPLVEFVLQSLRIILPARHIRPESFDLAIPDFGCLINRPDEIGRAIPIGPCVNG